jgi:hypothetical protein
MEKVGNIEGSAKTEPPYPAVYINQWQEDEIDLVDLWIVMWSYRRLFLSSAILIFVTGILCFELFYLEKPTSSVRSIVEIESVVVRQKKISVIDPDILINRIEYSKLPRFSSLVEFEKIKPLIMTTTASPLKQGSNIVAIVSKASTGDIADVSRFHEQLVDEIQLDLKKSAVMVTAGVNDTLYSLKTRIIQLRRNVINLEGDLIKRANSQVASNKSAIDIITSKKANLESEIDTLTERIENMELIQSNAGSLVLLRAGVTVNPPGFSKRFAYPMILMLSLLMALFATKGVIFARKVKERMAAEG